MTVDGHVSPFCNLAVDGKNECFIVTDLMKGIKYMYLSSDPRVVDVSVLK